MKKLLLLGTIVFSTLSASHSAIAASSYLDAYNNSTDYRSTVDSGLKSPAAGGIFYAYKILTECKAVAANFASWSENLSLTKDRAQAQRRTASLQLLKSRCENFSEEELSDEYLHKLFSEGAVSTDPLFAASLSYSKLGNSARGESSTQAKRLEAVSAVVRVKDPLVAQDLGLRLVIGVGDKPGKANFRANGKNSLLNSKVDMGHATFLVPCEMGLKCDGTDFAVTLPCASEGICDANRYEAVKRMVGQSGGDYHGIVKAAKDIAQSIVRPNASSRVLD